MLRPFQNAAKVRLDQHRRCDVKVHCETVYALTATSIVAVGWPSLFRDPFARWNAWPGPPARPCITVLHIHLDGWGLDRECRVLLGLPAPRSDSGVIDRFLARPVATARRTQMHDRARSVVVFSNLPGRSGFSDTRRVDDPGNCMAVSHFPRFMGTCRPYYARSAPISVLREVVLWRVGTQNQT